MSVFLETNHLFLRSPEGGVQDAVAMDAAGFGAIFCNIKDFAPGEWDVVRDNAERAGVLCGPWSRMCSGEPNAKYDRAYLDALIACAYDWGNVPYIVNAEDEVNGHNDHVAEIVAECGTDDWALSMLPTPFFDNDWSGIKVPVLPQCFGPSYADAYEVRRQWQARGVNCVVATFGTYSDWKPELYPLDGPFGLYTADDCGGDFERWTATGSCQPCSSSTPKPPPTNGGTVPGNDIPAIVPGERIGTEHGITALVDWLQKQPGMPARGASYDPRKPGTWPWPERLERTLKILAADHDAET